MKRYLLILSLICSCAYGQKYSCVQLTNDLATWNDSKMKNTTDWALAIKEKGLYKQNVDGSFEYVYILSTDDSIDVKVLRRIGFNYISYYFKIDNTVRAAMETNSPADGVFFQGKLNNVGVFPGFGMTNHVNANIYFDIRFKPNRIRFSVKIQDYQVLVTDNKSGAILENRQVFVSNCFPLNEDSKHKKSFAMAFVNSNSHCMNYAAKYLDYVNANITQNQSTVSDDW